MPITPTNIKLICSDIDGTLLQYGKKTLEAEILSQIKALSARGILFCPASGRQYTSLRKLFEPVADCCVFLCENGGVLYKNEQCIGKTPMPRALAEEIAWDMWNRCDGQGEVMLSGQCCGYLMSRGLGMADRVKFIGNKYKFIHDPAEIPEDIVKVSVYLHEGVEKYVDRFVPRWQQANAAVAGPYWIDTTLANKGTGVALLCKTLGITPAEVMAFGDNFNDTAMLDLVGTPYIMDSAAPRPARPLPAAHTPARGRAAYPFGIYVTQTTYMQPAPHPYPFVVPTWRIRPSSTKYFTHKSPKCTTINALFSVDAHAAVCYYYNDLMEKLRPDFAEN